AQGGVFVLGYEFSLLIHYHDALTTGLEPVAAGVATAGYLLSASHGSAQLRIPLAGELQQAFLFDAAGHDLAPKVWQEGTTLVIDLSSAAAGCYTVLAHTDQATHRARVMLVD
ncbi:MAG: hypothetical protein ABI432_05145, partial [Flavobacteriales bacterium]